MCDDVRDKAKADKITMKDALAALRIEISNFGRKRGVAEAMILDPISFQQIKYQLSKSAMGRRINQEDLMAECKKLFKKPTLQQKLRVAVHQMDAAFKYLLISVLQFYDYPIK